MIGKKLMNDPIEFFNSQTFYNLSLRTAYGNEFNYWMPIYTNDDVFKKYKKHFFNSLFILENILENFPNQFFDPQCILKILPFLIDRITILIQSVWSMRAYQLLTPTLNLFFCSWDSDSSSRCYVLIRKLLKQRVKEKNYPKNIWGSYSLFLQFLIFLLMIKIYWYYFLIISYQGKLSTNFYSTIVPIKSFLSIKESSWKKCKQIPECLMRKILWISFQKLKK